MKKVVSACLLVSVLFTGFVYADMVSDAKEMERKAREFAFKHHLAEKMHNIEGYKAEIARLESQLEFTPTVEKPKLLTEIENLQSRIRVLEREIKEFNPKIVTWNSRDLLYYYRTVLLEELLDEKL